MPPVQDRQAATVIAPATPHGNWAWAGLRLRAARDLTRSQEYASLPEDQRLARAVREQSEFLAGRLGAPAGSVLELRWLWDPASSRLHAHLLTRVWAPDPATADAAARTETERLARTAPHVVTEPLDGNELRTVLAPFDAAPGGAAEIRRRLFTETPNRPDAGVQFYAATQPFAGASRHWEGLLTALTAHPHPVALSVALTPVTVPASTRTAVAHCATAYKRLATDGEFESGSLYHGKVKVTADAFAVRAEQLYADAGLRYVTNAFRMRLSLWSPLPFDDSLPSLAGETFSRGAPGLFDGRLDPAALGPAYRLVRPADPAQAAVFAGNTGWLDSTLWGDDGGWAQAMPPALQPLEWLADLEEASAVFRLPLALNGFVPGFPVQSVEQVTTLAYAPRAPHVVLGYAADGRTRTPLGVELDDLTRHSLIVGGSGSGKTNSTLSLCRQLWADHGIPFTVLEPVNTDHDDYRWLATLPGFEEMLVLTAGDEETAPLRINPFEVPAGVRISTHAGNLLDCFDAAFGLWDPLPYLYRTALTETYRRKGLDVNATARGDEEWPVLGDFVDVMENVADGYDYAGEARANIVAASRLRARSLAEGACGPVLSAPRSMPIGELLGRPVVVELASLGDSQQQALVMALLLNAMTEHYKVHRRSSRLAHVTLVEEAHRLLRRPQPGAGSAKEGDATARAAEAFANTLAENRKYGEGLVVIEQDPSKLIPDAYKNTALKIVHQLKAEEDRRLVGDTMLMSDDQRDHAAVLPMMSAYAAHSRIDRPVLVEVPDVRAQDAERLGTERAPLADRAELARRHARWAEESPVVAESLRPQAPCGFCPVDCALEFLAKRAAGQAAGFVQLMEEGTAERFAVGWWERLADYIDEAGEAERPRHVPSGDSHWRVALLRAIHASTYPKSLAEPATTRRAAEWVRQFRRYLDSPAGHAAAARKGS
ncbi:ATP-binding protein [Streptomyces sp. NPDC058122]|uniref:ATP-binding protein n=1 Tax=Streptomyces sp. NPDC058122 TaxID=3346349 RepID=UPI0036EEB8A2